MAVAVESRQVVGTLRVSYGRLMNSDTYGLPSDTPEMQRLALQHRLWTLLAAGLYPPQAQQAVNNAIRRADAESRRPKVLDVGSGSGCWAVEMAQRFPNADVFGIDLAESKPPIVPYNCQFKKGDAMIMLNEYAGQFDIIQCRSVAKHVPDALLLTRNIGRALRPGGVFIFADALRPVFDAHLQIFPPAHSGSSYEENASRSWTAKWMGEVSDRWMSKAGKNTDGDKLHHLMREDGQFKDIDSVIFNGPIGWDGGALVHNGNGSEVGRLMGLNWEAFLEASKPSLLASGLPEDVVDTWRANCLREIEDPLKRAVMKWAFNWGIKSDQEPASL